MAEKEYIEREAAKEAVVKAIGRGYSPFNAIVMLPAADVRPVRMGKWEKGTGENGVTTSLFCSVCHYENTHWREWNFCPNCGAKMEES